jgi:hypothetical protein
VRNTPAPTFAERGSLLIHGYVEAVGDQRVRREQTADTSTTTTTENPILFGSAPFAAACSSVPGPKELSDICSFKLSFPAG